MAYEARLDARITAPVDRRLRTLAAIRRQSLSQLLTVLLDQALPSAEELAGLLLETGRSS